MLRKLRQKDIKKVMWALVIIIVPAFAFWGISSVLQNRSRAIGVIGKEKISRPEFENYEKYLEMFFFFAYGPDFLSKINNQQLISLTWEQLILQKQAEKEKIKASDADLINKLKSLPLLNQKGKFNQSFYLARLKMAGIIPSQFEKFLKGTICVDKLIAKIYAQVKVTDKELLKYYRQENEKAKISYLLIKYSQIAAQIKPTSQQLKAYYQSHLKFFRLPPKVKIAYIIIPQDKIAALKDTLKKLRKKYDLAVIAKALALQPEESDYFSLSEPIKDLGWAKEINKVAFSLENGQTSQPLLLKTNKIIIIKRLSTRPGYVPTFKGIEAKVKASYLKEKAQTKAKALAGNLLKIVKEKQIKDLKQLLSFVPSKEEKAVIFAQSGYFKRYSYLKEIGFSKELMQAVFTAKKGEILNKYFLVKPGVCLIKLDDFVPIDPAKFQEEKAQYKRRILRVKRQIAFNNYLMRLYKNSKLFLPTLP